MQHVIINRGLIASGKSTFAKQLLELNPQFKRINRDDLRKMVDNGKWSKYNEKLIVNTRNTMIRNFLEAGYDVIVDDTNLSSGVVTDIKKVVQSVANKIKNQIHVETKWHEISLEDAIERDSKRTGRHHIGEEAIQGMWNRFHLSTNLEIRKQTKEILEPVIKESMNIEQDIKLPKAIICDIDGTLAIKGDRSPYDVDKVDLDTVNTPVADLINNYYNQTTNNGEPVYIIIFSGRDGSCQEKTIQWLADNNIGYDVLYMRTAGDNRKDSIIKRELYEQYVKDRYNVMFVLDDRNQVVDLWRQELGLPCFQVNYGDF